MDRTPVIVGIGRSDFSRDSGRTTLALAAVPLVERALRAPLRPG